MKLFALSRMAALVAVSLGLPATSHAFFGASLERCVELYGQPLPLSKKQRKSADAYLTRFHWGSYLVLIHFEDDRATEVRYQRLPENARPASRIISEEELRTLLQMNRGRSNWTPLSETDETITWRRFDHPYGAVYDKQRQIVTVAPLSREKNIR